MSFQNAYPSIFIYTLISYPLKMLKPPNQILVSLSEFVLGASLVNFHRL